MTTPNRTQTCDRGVFLCRVIANEPICREHWRLVVEVDNFPTAAPGQFVQVRCCDPDDDDGCQGGTFIRRPFSIAGLRRDGRRCEIDVVHRVVGVGTCWLSQREPGDAVSVLGPLGRPFAIEQDRPVAYLVGGGIGLPPLIWLASHLRDAGRRAVAFCGSRSAGLLPLTRRSDVLVSGDEGSLAFGEFADVATPVVVATDDGSLGAAGLIPDVFARYLDQHPEDGGSAVVYSCGPERMIETVSGICETRGIPCRVCLERMMACGMGTCQSCVVPVRDEAAGDGWCYRLCCTDGPVFDSRLVIWDQAPGRPA